MQRLSGNPGLTKNKRMKRLSLFVLLFVSAISAANAQTEEYITLGINGGVLHNINGYRKDTNYYGHTFKNGIPGYNVAVDLGIRTSARTRFRLEIEHEEFHYKALWDTAKMTYKIKSKIYETRAKIWNMGVNLRFDYLLGESEKWKIFVSPGLLWEFNVARESKNLKVPYVNPLEHHIREKSYYNYDEIAYENPDHILGGNVQLLCKYKIAKHIAITLTPEYYIYFRGMVKTNYGKPYQRLTLNGGLEFNF